MLTKYHGATPAQIFGEQYVYELDIQDGKIVGQLILGVRARGLTFPQYLALRHGIEQEIEAYEKARRDAEREDGRRPRIPLSAYKRGRVPSKRAQQESLDDLRKLAAMGRAGAGVKLIDKRRKKG